MKKITHNDTRGFTLLFAVLVATLLLSIGLAIANVTLTQLTLSSSGKESQFAFYNADSGIECALMYEYKYARTDGSRFFASSNSAPQQNIVCEGKTATVLAMEYSGSAATTTFMINPAQAGCSTKADPSFIVKVGKSVRDVYSSNVYIESRGYNTCDSNNPRRLERGLYTKFID